MSHHPSPFQPPQQQLSHHHTAPHQQPQQQPQQSGTPTADTVQPTLRVMRLYKPYLHISTPAAEVTQFSRCSAVESDFALTQLLLLPESFGDIYIGETFSAYMSAINSTDLVLRSVTLNTRLQTPNNAQVDLPDIRADPAASEEAALTPMKEALHKDEALDMVVKHTLNLLGTHTLRVTVQYIDPRTSEKKSTRKFYRFSVLNPVTVRCKLIDQQQKYYVQCSVTNVTKSLLIINNCQLQLERPFTDAEPLFGNAVTDGRPVDLLDSLSMLAPDECYSCAFAVDKPLVASDAGQVIGKLQLSWTSAMGEHGIIVGDPITAIAAAQPVEIRCVQCPANVLLGDEFTAVISITNHTHHPLSLQLQCKNDEARGLFVTGTSHCNLPLIEPNNSIQHTLRLYPAAPGLQAFSDVVACDTKSTQRHKPLGNLASVVVHTHAETMQARSSSFHALQEESDTVDMFSSTPNLYPGL